MSDTSFRVEIGPGPRFDVRATVADGSVRQRTYLLPGTHQNDYLDFYASLAADFGTLVPANRRAHDRPSLTYPYRVLLTENVGEGVLYGYGDPAVIRIEEDGGPAWYLVATSNDAPDAFPILRSRDLKAWEHRGFVFPAGSTPPWAATGEGVSDYWAAEMHRVGGRYVVVFTARRPDGELAIGIATADRPEGPFDTAPRPLLAGGVIDSHLLATSDGRLFLYWKEDTNALWPGRLVALLRDRPELVDRLLDEPAARRTADFLCVIDGWVSTRPPMEQFALQQPLIEAVIEQFAEVRARLRGWDDAEEVRAAMRTRIFAQRLSPETLELEGERREVLANDRDWEAHLVEGIWVSEQAGRFYAFYAANDFATDNYGIGVAVGGDPSGPFVKRDVPFLRSCAEWSGPGHPSVAAGPDGKPLLFLHAFVPGTGGYKIFRALLALPLVFEADGVRVG